MEPMSIAELAKLTGHSVHTVSHTVKQMGLTPVFTKPIGRYPRQYFDNEELMSILKAKKPHKKNGPQQR